MKIDRDAPVGVFDSGIGGLTVAREIMRQIPNEKIIYFGDTARMPYGSKSKETVTRFSKQIVRFLETFQVKTIVVACNTASAYALDELEKEIDVPIIGVIKPGARTAAVAAGYSYLLVSKGSAKTIRMSLSREQPPARVERAQQEQDYAASRSGHAGCRLFFLRCKRECGGLKPLPGAMPEP